VRAHGSVSKAACAGVRASVAIALRRAAAIEEAVLRAHGSGSVPASWAKADPPKGLCGVECVDVIWLCLQVAQMESSARSSEGKGRGRSREFFDSEVGDGRANLFRAAVRLSQASAVPLVRHAAGELMLALTVGRHE